MLKTIFSVILLCHITNTTLSKPCKEDDVDDCYYQPSIASTFPKQCILGKIKITNKSGKYYVAITGERWEAQGYIRKDKKLVLDWHYNDYPTKIPIVGLYQYNKKTKLWEGHYGWSDCASINEKGELVGTLTAEILTRKK